MTEQTTVGRRVVTNMSLSLDGHYAGPGDARDMSWVMPYAVTDVARDHLTSLWEPATTALLGRVNAEGFLGFWPTVIGMEGADPRDEAFAKWLVDTDQVDRLALTVFPVFLGGGPRLFDDGLPARRWALAGQAAGEHGTLSLTRSSRRQLRQSAAPTPRPP
ncbi:dihydrofolate reductase family protein [Nonomuraea sp. RK-328]|nr:dihydrofolate reductase family protein [Nonomuraea sp. RK-328]